MRLLCECWFLLTFYRSSSILHKRLYKAFTSYEKEITVKGKYTVNEVEERTHVPATTLRQWERRYGFPQPERSESGYRLYNDADLQHIEVMKRYIADGIPASRAADLVRRSNAVAKAPRSLEILQKDLVLGLVSLDETKANDILSEAHALHSVEAVMFSVINPAMVELGELWHQGKINTTIEHFASSYIYGRLRALLSLSSSLRNAPAVIVACAPSDQHELGALMLAVSLRRAGYCVCYIGANTPIADLAEMAKTLMPVAVMISAATSSATEYLAESLTLLKNMAPQVVFGGRAFNENPELAKTFGGVYLGADISQAVETLDRLIKSGVKSL
jgi:MerR family transcriptional regulator, light-induced transcriptional regulator